MRNVTRLVIFLCFSFSLSCAGQDLHLYSIRDSRQTAGDKGYTLDGSMMSGGPRSKLVNLNNFGPTGTYKKRVVIHDTFETSGSMRGIYRLPKEAVLFFGTFDKSNASTKPFTKEELDSVYSWSRRGGRIIVAHGLTFMNGDLRIMNDHYGFTMGNSSGGEELTAVTYFDPPNPFNGAFGSLQSVAQAGMAQGYYDKLPENVRILGADAAGRPTLVMDCYTMDLLVADVDVFTMLNQEMGALSNMSSPTERFWGNVIAFMDGLQPAPLLARNGSVLSVQDQYQNYQWFKDGKRVDGATGNTFEAGGSGAYYVEVPVNGGCKVVSDTYYTPDVDPALNCDIVVPTAFSPDGNGVNEKACAYSYCTQAIDFRIFDRWGELVFQSASTNECWDGTYKGTRLNGGTFAWTIKATLPSGTEISRKGHITLVN